MLELPLTGAQSGLARPLLTQPKLYALRRVGQRVFHEQKKINGNVIEGRSLYQDLYEIIEDYRKLETLLAAFLIVVRVHATVPHVAAMKHEPWIVDNVKQRLWNGTSEVNMRPVGRQTLYQHVTLLIQHYTDRLDLLAHYCAITQQELQNKG